MDSLILPWVNAETMTLFLATVAERHADKFIVMVMDRAGWHIAGDLIVPDNMRLVYLSPYSPELNPAEHLWESLWEKLRQHRGPKPRCGRGKASSKACAPWERTRHAPEA